MSKSGKIFAVILILIAVTAIVIFFWPKKPITPAKQTANQSLPPKIPATTLFFAGDIMLSRNVAAKIYSQNDFTLPFQKVKDETAAADIAFANLESPFNQSGDHSIDGSLVFNADPQSVAGLTSAGFDILSTANNHAFDQGKLGIDFTYNWLKQHGIIPVGTTNSSFDLSQNVIKKNNVLFGFLSYSYTALNDGGKTTSPYVADFNDLAQVRQDILNLKGHYADVVIVNMHAGTEYTRLPTQSQINFAHAAIDAGADLVVGEHPHWVQTIEQYKGKWIFYSLGNFVFDQMWSEETRQGLTLKITYQDSTISKIELKPVIVDDYCCPRWANQEETKSILSKINLTDPILFQHN